MKDNLNHPSMRLLVKLGSIIMHFDEYNSAGGHPFDLQAARELLKDEEVLTWMNGMKSRAYLPHKRSES